MYVCTVSSSIIRSTSRPFVACALSPAFSKSLKVFRISLWSFFSSTIASVDIASRLVRSGGAVFLPALRRLNPTGVADHVDDAVHDLGEPEVLGGEDRGHTQLAQPVGVPGGDDATDHDGDVLDALVAQPGEDRRDQLHVRPREDRQPDAVHVLGDRGGHDLLRGQPDPLVDNLEPGVTGPHGDLLGAVRVPVEARLPHEQPQPGAELLPGAPYPLPDGGQLTARVGRSDRAGDAGGGAELAEDPTQGA